MTKSQIKDLIKNSLGGSKRLPLYEIAKLKKCANVPLEIDRETNDYYYEVDINELTGKEFDKKLITNYAWELTLDGEKMRLILE